MAGPTRFRSGMFLVSVLGLLLALWNFSAVLSDSPAFVEEARINGVFGEWRTRDNPSLYDRPAYMFQKGYGYLNADLIASEATEAADEVADVQTGTERARKAAELFEASLALDPANAHVWTALAWARVNVDSIAQARQAMLASWELAPNHAELALDRLSFVELLTGPLAELLETPLSEAEKAHIARDVIVAQRFRPREYELISEAFEASGVAF